MTLRREDEVPNMPAVRWGAYRRVEKERDEALDVLRDLLFERGLPEWMLAVVSERAALVTALQTHANGNHRSCCRLQGEPVHQADCEAQRLLRLLDPDETQRQVDEAHVEAIAEQERRNRPARNGPMGPGLSYVDANRMLREAFSERITPPDVDP